MGWIVLLWGTLFVGKKHGPQKGKVAGAEASGVSTASPERTGGKGHGREAYGSASRRSSWHREASPSFVRPGPPGRRPRPAPRAGDQSPALPLSLRVPLSSRLCPFDPLAGWDAGRSGSRTGTPTKEGRDEARGDLPGHRPERRLSPGASLRSSAHAPALRRGGSAGGGKGRRLHRHYCANSPVGACAHGPAPGSCLPFSPRVPMAASDTERAQQQVSGGGGEEGSGEPCVCAWGVTGRAAVSSGRQYERRVESGDFRWLLVNSGLVGSSLPLGRGAAQVAARLPLFRHQRVIAHLHWRHISGV